MNRAASFFLLTVVITASVHAQLQPPVRVTTAGVLIDVTVLDSKGQPVLDLKPEDFELTDNGKRQQVVSVTLVRGGARRSLAPSGSVERSGPVRPGAESTISASPDPQRGIENTPTVTAILFDRLSQESRPLARTAALAYVSTLTSPSDRAGIFLGDLTLVTIQPFTNDGERLRRAIDVVAATAPAIIDTEYLQGRRAASLDPSQPPTAGAESASPGWTTVAEREQRLRELNMIELMLAKIELRMENSYRQFMTQYAGQASLAGLRAAVHALSALEGRKSVLYFAETLPVTADLKAKYEELIGQANRANVTFYPVDAVGLRVHSEEAKVGRNVTLAGGQGIGDVERDGGAWTKELERQEQLLSSRPTAVLGRLAKGTGGFLIENTNDLGAGVARMQHERTTYYLLGYQPTNTTMDGKFRRVSVKVKRPKVSVRTRPGYLAVPPPA